MFTGLVQGAATVVSLSPREADGARLTLSHPLLASARAGDSIATNGCCLTVVDPRGEVASFDLLAETLRLTNLGELTAGSVVNLGGHFVTGHVDCVGNIAFLGREGADWRLDISTPETILRHIVRKGCVAVDGMSLTVADLIPGGFRIWLIPHTLEVTNLSRRKTGDRVNLESDLLAKYAEKLLGKA
jgi:riboflavin synthase